MRVTCSHFHASQSRREGRNTLSCRLCARFLLTSYTLSPFCKITSGDGSILCTISDVRRPFEYGGLHTSTWCRLFPSTASRDPSLAAAQACLSSHPCKNVQRRAATTYSILCTEPDACSPIRASLQPSKPTRNGVMRRLLHWLIDAM